MRSLRVLLAGFLAFCLFGRQDEPPPEPIRVTVNVLQMPVTVTDNDGNYVNNLKASDFRVLDNNSLQDINVDVTYQPISLVVAVQADSGVEKILPKLQNIGPMFQGAVTGDAGEVAVLCFDHRIQTLQDFTTDPDLISQAFKKLKPGSQSHRMIDAAMQAIYMLRRRPPERRRVLLMISETIDGSSENKTREVITLAQLENVVVYSVNMNRLISTLTAKPLPPRPDPIAPGGRPLPGNMPPTPEATRLTVTGASNSANFIPVFIEIFKQVKGIFVDNPVEVFTEFTGGREYSFLSERDVERAIQQVGAELHSQYFVSYTPNNKIEGGWHDVVVEILDSTGRPRRDIKVRAKPGYWMAAVPE